MATVTDPGSATAAKNVVAFLVALFVLISILIAVTSCGDDDLILPGSIPFTPTSVATDTPDPDEEE
jgi:hypothetical protein